MLYCNCKLIIYCFIFGWSLKDVFVHGLNLLLEWRARRELNPRPKD